MLKFDVCSFVCLAFLPSVAIELHECDISRHLFHSDDHISLEKSRRFMK